MHPVLTYIHIAATLSRTTFDFDFPSTPYTQGVHRIHSPERICSPLFKLGTVDKPFFENSRASISFSCSTPFISNMRVRMFTSEPQQSNLFFFKDGRALYVVRLRAIPTNAFQAHRLQLEITFCGSEPNRAVLKSLLPILFMVTRSAENRTAADNCYLAEYRRGVLRGTDDFWVVAERVIRTYFG